jgi:hypothetical protein
MADPTQELLHRIVTWNAAGPYLRPELVPNLAEYLTNFLRSPNGEQFLRLLGYVKGGEK